MRRTFLFLALVLSTFPAFSQSYTETADEKLQLLDKSLITTHILYDRVYPGAGLREFHQIFKSFPC